MTNVDAIKILLVEDDFAHAKLVEVFLAGSNQFETDITHVLSLADCLKKLSVANYDVILLDLNLTDSSGINTLEKLFEHSPYCSVVVLTGQDNVNIGIQAVKIGAQDFLNKINLDTETLSSAVQYATARKKLQTEFRKTSESLKKGQELAKMGNYEFDGEDNSVFWSDQLYNILGITKKSKPTFKTYFYKIPKHQRVRVFQQLKKAIHNLSSFSIEHKIEINDKLYYVRNVGNATSNKLTNSIKVVGFVQDITDYKEAEKESYENRKRYEIIVNESQEAIYVSTFDGHLKEHNTAFLNLTGLTEEELSKSKTTVNDLYADLSQREYFKKEIQNKGSIKNYPAKLLKQTGDKNNPEVIDCLITANLWKDQDGKIVEYHGIIRDITEQKKTEKLREAAKVAERAATIKNKFLANMSHEIRTPMNVVVGMTDLLQKTSLSEKQHEYLRSMKISSENLMEIINAILDFSKIEAGKVFLEQKPLKLHKLIEDLFQIFKHKAKDNNISLFKQLDANLPEVVIGDTLRLNQILLNLLSNAIKYTNGGEVTLKVMLLEETDNSFNIKFSVKDNGIGIPEDKFPTIFEGFTQASEDTSRLYGGTGLGLPIAKELVELMKGTISVESEPDKGSTFIFNVLFDKCKDDQKIIEIETEDDEIISAFDKETEIQILLVEDHIMNQIVVSDLLKREFKNIKIDFAENGQIGVDKVKENFYHLVLMDINMPVLNGLEATKIIRKEVPDPKCNVPIFALTAHAFSSEVNNCIDAGMNEFVSKPINIKDLKGKIVKVLNEVIPAEEGTRGNNKIDPIENNKVDTKIIEEKDSENNKENIDEYLDDGKYELKGEEYKSVINLDYLNEIAGNDEGTLKVYIDLILKNTPAELETLKIKLLDENWDELSKIAHKLKGSVSYMGIDAIKETIQAVENNAAREVDLDKIEEKVEEVIKYCNMGLKELSTKKNKSNIKQ